ncbi:MAG: hypothetical protein IT355_05495 [Gemmatimonadaceae bacterium]|nr:hypothetical protein [Gemmatimonadaceae bacterium]
MSTRPPFHVALRPSAPSRRDRALQECLAGARALQAGLTDAGLARYRAAVALTPNDAEVAALHGVALRSAARLADAQRELIRAIALDGQRADSFTQLAQAYRMTGDTDQAAQAFLAAAMLQTTDATAWRDAAESLRLAGRIGDGLAAARHAATLAPGDPSIANTTALLLHRDGHIDAALALCDRVRASAPEDLNLALTHAMLLRTVGRHDEGWTLYERRLELPTFRQRPHTPNSPRWTGGDLTGRHILVRAEQGLGDQVQFVRWACFLRAVGAGTVTVQVAQPLIRLLKTAPGIDAVVAADRPPPPHQLHVDLLSLPHLMRTGGHMQSHLVPYLSAPGAPPACARRLPAPARGTIRIGLVWAGTPLHADDRTRSMPLTALLPALDQPSVKVIVLQQGPPRAELELVPPALKRTVTDVVPECVDMGETAHVMAECDVILTVDTAVAHVAGAMGLSTWLMVAHPAEWRWGRDRTASDYYPSMRIIRQQRSGDWSDVVCTVRQCITEWLDRKDG